MQNGGPATRLRVLLVEDETVVAMLVEEMLADIGHEVAGTASTLDEALEASEIGSFDVAILDINLNGKPSYAVAERLASRGIPVVFATGYGARAPDAKFPSVPVLPKPFASGALQQILSQFDRRP